MAERLTFDLEEFLLGKQVLLELLMSILNTYHFLRPIFFEMIKMKATDEQWLAALEDLKETINNFHQVVPNYEQFDPDLPNKYVFLVVLSVIENQTVSPRIKEMFLNAFPFDQNERPRRNLN